jgi:hypothetical protein
LIRVSPKFLPRLARLFPLTGLSAFRRSVSEGEVIAQVAFFRVTDPFSARYSAFVMSVFIVKAAIQAATDVSVAFFAHINPR